MKWSFSDEAPEGAKTDALVLGVHDDLDFGSLPGGKALKENASRLRFKGSVAETFFGFELLGHPKKHVLVVGLGPLAGAGPGSYRAAAAAAARKLRERFLSSAALFLPLPEEAGARFGAAEALIEGFLLGNHPLQKYRTDKEVRFGGLKTLLVLVGADGEDLESAARRGAVMAEATAFARDLVSEPSNVMTPSKFADIARKVAKEAGIKLKVYGAKECEEMGMGAYLAVARGSHQDPQFLHFSYRPRAAKFHLGLVGKGLTFDSGGISLKPGEGMGAMKSDMSGAAAVLGAIKAIGELKPKVRVDAVMALCENMPDGKACRPGDIVTSMDGKTIEILNTDAEGRLTLADALTFIQREKVDAVIDLATLTGACMVALGPDFAGAMGNDQAFLDEFMGAARTSGDEIWQLPLPPAYKKFIKSTLADISNLSRVRWGGALTAGLFLQEFIKKGTPWIHLDIAGPALRDEDGTDAFRGEGSGVGVRPLLRYILSKE